MEKAQSKCNTLLSCIVSFLPSPMPSITWKKGGVILSNNAKFDIKDNDRRLVVNNPVKGDTATYSCSVSNPKSVGAGQRSANLTVYGEFPCEIALEISGIFQNIPEGLCVNPKSSFEMQLFDFLPADPDRFFFSRSSAEIYGHTAEYRGVSPAVHHIFLPSKRDACSTDFLVPQWPENCSRARRTGTSER